jgi:hypothetical protein
MPIEKLGFDMSRTSVKVLIAALLLYAGAVAAGYIGSIPPPPDTFIIEDPSWSMWDYLSCGFFLLAVGLTIAAIKLRRS